MQESPTSNLPPVVLVLVYGPVGAGKTTLLRGVHLPGNIKLRAIEFDDALSKVMKEDQTFDSSFWHRALEDFFQSTVHAIENALAERSDSAVTVVVAIDNFYYRSMRRRFYHLAMSFNELKAKRVAFGSLCIIAPLSTCLQRNNARDPKSRIPDEVVQSIFDRLEIGPIGKPKSDLMFDSGTEGLDFFSRQFLEFVLQLTRSCEFCPVALSTPLPEPKNIRKIYDERIRSVAGRIMTQYMERLSRSNSTSGASKVSKEDLKQKGAELSALKSIQQKRLREAVVVEREEYFVDLAATEMEALYTQWIHQLTSLSQINN